MAKAAAPYVELTGERVWRGAPALQDHLVPIERVKPDPRNARAHNPFNLKTIQESLRKFGQQELLIVRPNGTLVAGEGRLRAITQAPDLGWTHVAAVVFAGSDSMAKQLGLVLNRSGELAEWNIDNLTDLITEFQDDNGVDLEALGFRDQEVKALLDGDGMNGETTLWQPGDGEEDGARMGGQITHLILPATQREANEIMKLLRDLQAETGAPTLTAALLQALRERNAGD